MKFWQLLVIWLIGALASLGLSIFILYWLWQLVLAAIHYMNTH